MKVNVLNDEIMKKQGFNSVHENSKWYLYKDLGLNISLNITVNKDNGSFVIDVLDEDFLQPYDYQYILINTPGHKIANEVRDKVTEIILDLVDKGIIEDYKVGDYI